MPRIGGNSALSTGFFNAAPGDERSLERLEEETAAVGGFLGEPALVRKLCREAPSALAWLEQAGAKLREGRFRVYGAQDAWARQPESGSGESFVKAALAYATAHGATIHLQAALEGLLRRSSDAAPEVRIRFGGEAAASSASPVQSRLEAWCPDAVVLAVGGFSANAALCARFDQRLAGLAHTGGKGADGDALLAAADAGAAFTDMDFIQCVPGAMPGAGERVPLHLLLNHFIWLNGEGHRFVAEDAPRSVVRDAFLVQPGRSAYAVIDAEGFAAFAESQQRQVLDAVKRGAAWQAESIEELARRMGLSADAVRSTVERFNRSAASGADHELGRRALAHPIETPPFYASASVMSVHCTLGGLAIDHRTRVLDQAGEVIPGLYAAGEAAGGVHGEDRLGGNGLAEAAVFGLAAGREAARFAWAAARSKRG